MDVHPTMTMNMTAQLAESFAILSDSRMYLHLLLLWVVSLVFSWIVFSVFSRRNFSGDVMDVPRENSSSLMPPPKDSPPAPRNVFNETISKSPTSTSLHNEPISRSLVTPQKSSCGFLRQLELEVCQKAKEAGKHPSYVNLVLNLVHNYNVDINKPVMTKRFSIFHSACLSCCPELVSSLSPMAQLEQRTAQGDSALYLAVYAACHRVSEQPRVEEDGLEVVRHLLEAGCDVNSPNKAGWTALHQANRRGHGRMIRLLLDWGAQTRTGHNTTISSPRSPTSVNTTLNTPRSSRNVNSTLNSSVITRSMSKRANSTQGAR